MSENDELNRAKQLIEEVGKLQPAPTDLDPRVVFYEAGFAACRAQLGSVGRVPVSALVAACLLAVVVTVPVSYYAGRTAANQANSQDSLVADQSRPSSADTASRHEVATEIASQAELTPSTLEPIGPAKSDSRSGWFSPLASLAASARFEREASPMLTVFHSSLVSRGETDGDWTEFPFPTPSSPPTQSRVSVEAPRTQPLAASDLNELAISLERIR